MANLALSPLPIDEHLDDVVSRAVQARSLALTAAPGAGKTTRVPPALLKALPRDRPEALLLEPRRLAVRAAADRIAHENGWALGGEVGYQVRFESKTSARTRLTAMTEGLFVRKLASDPELARVGCVILDEFHERSWHVDVALGLLYELQQTSRPDLMIVVMSATLESERVAAFLGGAPIVDVPGRAFPVDIVASQQPQLLQTGPDFVARVAGQLRALMDGSLARVGDVLCFLPGAGEIAAVARAVSERASARGFDVFPLHGGLSLDEQARAIRSGPRPKIVLSTNVAETSVTVDGVGTVVDCGLARTMSHEPEGFPRLELGRISRFSAVQRAGRAGRQGPGLCYRLWTGLDERSMPESNVPEILRMDLSEATLALASQGVSRPESFSWIEAPPRDRLAAAQKQLQALGALDESGAITADGRALLGLPLEPRLAKLALEGARRGSAELAAGLAAVLSEKDLLRDARDARRLAAAESDPLARCWIMSEGRGSNPFADEGAVFRARRARDQIAAAARAAASRAPIPVADAGAPPGAGPRRFDDEADEAKYLLFTAFSDRLARRRDPADVAGGKGRAPGGPPGAGNRGGASLRLVGGRGAQLSPHSACERAELMVCARAAEIERGGRVELSVEWASEVERAWIAARFPERLRARSWVGWDADERQVLAFTAQCYLDLPLEEAKAGRASPEDAAPLLAEAIAKKWDSMLARDEDAAQLVARLAFARATMPEREWPAIDDAFKRRAAEALAYGETRLDAIEKKNWSEAIEACVPDWHASARAHLDREAPARFEAPTGSRIRIEYPLGQAPYVEVRIQETFGLRETPRLAMGRAPLQMRLLGPNFRPAQVTQDLASFWKNGYPEVRKELRARYPKHSWPEDPLSAKPEAKGRRHR